MKDRSDDPSHHEHRMYRVLEPNEIKNTPIVFYNSSITGRYRLKYLEITQFKFKIILISIRKLFHTHIVHGQISYRRIIQYQEWFLEKSLVLALEMKSLPDCFFHWTHFPRDCVKITFIQNALHPLIALEKRNSSGAAILIEQTWIKRLPQNRVAY